MSSKKSCIRWSGEEVEFLTARFTQPFPKTLAEFRAARPGGVKRSGRAISVKYYALKREWRARTARRRGVGEEGIVSIPSGVHTIPMPPPLQLARQYEVEQLQAAVEIRGVLDGLEV